MFDRSAQYYIDNKMGRRITKQELLEILKMGEEKALVLSPTNAKKITSICLCCGCCCGLLRMIKNLPRPADHVQSPYQATIDPELCTECDTCRERCQMEAIKEDESGHKVEEARCIGCGLCVLACPTGAISLIEKSGVATVPENFVEMQKRIAIERGIL
jgi:Fe-S-cluster-containing hydrogenase component 2